MFDDYHDYSVMQNIIATTYYQANYKITMSKYIKSIRKGFVESTISYYQTVCISNKWLRCNA